MAYSINILINKIMSTYKTRKAQAKKAGAGANSESAQERALNLFADMMIEKIESIMTDWSKPWFTEGIASWPKNLSGRCYNGMNSLMLLMHCEKQGYKYPVFCTFDRVMGLNYNKTSVGNVPAVDAEGNKRPMVSVNKGEKSFPVFLTCFTVVEKDTNNKIKYEEYRQMSDSEKEHYNVYPSTVVYNVFNIDQTNMKEARPEIYEKIILENGGKKQEHKGEMFHFDAMDRMMEENRWICPIKQLHGDSAFYSISKKLIVLPEFSQFKDGESFYGTAFHEMAHSTGAEEHLNRLKPAAFGSAEYAQEELVAELTSAMVCQYCGMDKYIKEDSAPYLKSWLSSLQQDAQYIKTILLDVKRASAMITKAIEECTSQAAVAA